MLRFSNTYAELGDAFYQRLLPTPVSNPKLLLWNSALAEQLQITSPLLDDPDLQAQVFVGNKILDGTDAMSLTYSGHQFGQLNPQLGDGRAHLLGEVLDKDQKRFDIQLKGSGPTPYSRGGDGRCALGPALREYIMSEAMYFLGVPTSRCLAVVASGEPVYREGSKPGAVVTRVAASHIRVGTFVYFAIRNDTASLQALMDYTIARHFPWINQANKSDNSGETENPALAFLGAVIDQQISLIVEWMRVGFIHGVMNTDNCAVSGETIDFGPCAMMGTYNPDTVFSSIDHQRRYAYGNQANIMLWNMTRLAECLLPFIADQQEDAIEQAKALLEQSSTSYESEYLNMLAHKLGLADHEQCDSGFILHFLSILQEKELDYTQTFLQLVDSLFDETLALGLKVQLGSWYDNWRALLDNAEHGLDAAKALMKKNNPVVIPRNHHVERVLAECEASNNSDAAEDFLQVLRSPYDEVDSTKDYQDLPLDDDEGYNTFCGT
ncbi:MAG: hypothetical protein ACI9FB_002591 [Candidatus Azotimanducaceae bacterium]|jgi:uncharacterized protein YdiU (UPF0061 family)